MTGRVGFSEFTSLLIGTAIDNKKDQSVEKKPFVEPKLEFVEPKLEKHGEFTKISGYFGSFSP